MCQKPAVLQVTELLVYHKQTNSSPAFRESPVTPQLRLAKLAEPVFYKSVGHQ